MRINFYFNLDFIPVGSNCIDGDMRICLETGESVPANDDPIHLLTVSRSRDGELSFDDFISVSQKKWLDEAIGNVVRGGHPGHGYYDDIERLVNDMHYGEVNHVQAVQLMECLDLLQEKLEFYFESHSVCLMERNKLRMIVRSLRRRIAEEDGDLLSSYPELAVSGHTEEGRMKTKQWLDGLENVIKDRILRNAWMSCPRA